MGGGGGLRITNPANAVEDEGRKSASSSPRKHGVPKLHRRGSFKEDFEVDYEITTPRVNVQWSPTSGGGEKMPSAAAAAPKLPPPPPVFDGSNEMEVDDPETTRTTGEKGQVTAAAAPAPAPAPASADGGKRGAVIPFSLDYDPTLATLVRECKTEEVERYVTEVVSSQGEAAASKVVSMADPAHGFTPLMCAVCEECSEGMTKIMNILLKHGGKDGSTGICDKNGNTAHHWAARYGNHRAVALISYHELKLLESNKTWKPTFVNANRAGDTPLHIASKYGNVETCAMILKAISAYYYSPNRNRSLHPTMTCLMDARNRAFETAFDIAAVELRPNDGDSSSGSEISKSPVNRSPVNNDEDSPTDERMGRFLEARKRVRSRFLEHNEYFKTLVLHHEDCLKHVPMDNGTQDVWEAPARIDAIFKGMKDVGAVKLSTGFKCATIEQLERAHSPDYIKFVKTLSETLNGEDAKPVAFTPRVQKCIYKIDDEDIKENEQSDTSFSKGSWLAATRAAGSVVHAVDALFMGAQKRHRNVFCMVRPPGHHAGIDGLLEDCSSCGFCIFNNVAVGALHALAKYERVKKVCIVDFDVHHGNGTEEIVRRYNETAPEGHEIMFWSAHLYYKRTTYQFYPGTGESSDVVHNIHNEAMDPLWTRKSIQNPRTQLEKFYKSRTGRNNMRHVVTNQLLPAARCFNPDLIIVSAGFDAAYRDVGNCRFLHRYLNGFDLRKSDYTWMMQELARIASISCGGNIISVLEGGYGRLIHSKHRDSDGMKLDRSSLQENCVAHVQGMIDSAPFVDSEDEEDGEDQGDDYKIWRDEDEKAKQEKHMDRRQRVRRRPKRFEDEQAAAEEKAAAPPPKKKVKMITASTQTPARMPRKAGSKEKKADKKNAKGAKDKEAKKAAKKAAAEKKKKEKAAKGPPKTKVKKSAAKKKDGKAPKAKRGPKKKAPKAEPLMKKEDALNYLQTVKGRFERDIDRYHKFLIVMGEFKQNKRSIMDVIKNVRNLFMDDRHLITQFNNFLPAQFRIDTTNFPDVHYVPAIANGQLVYQPHFRSPDGRVSDTNPLHGTDNYRKMKFGPPKKTVKKKDVSAPNGPKTRVEAPKPKPSLAQTIPATLTKQPITTGKIVGSALKRIAPAKMETIN